MPIPAFARSMVLAYALAVSVSGCTTAPSKTNGNAIRIADGQAFAMQSGEQVTLSNRSQLHYMGVQSDSRCPPDVQCIQAGNAVVGFNWQPPRGGAQAFQLSTPEPPQSRDLGSLRLSLLSLAFGAAPQVRLRIERAR